MAWKIAWAAMVALMGYSKGCGRMEMVNDSRTAMHRLSRVDVLSWWHETAASRRRYTGVAATMHNRGDSKGAARRGVAYR